MYFRSIPSGSDAFFGGVTGQFASATLPRGFRLKYSGNQVSIAKKGMILIVQ